MPKTIELSRRNQKRVIYLNERCQMDAKVIAQRAVDHGPLPIRHLLRLRARVMNIGLIKAGLDMQGDYEARLEATLQHEGPQIGLGKLARVCASVEYALQPHPIYSAAHCTYKSYIQKLEPIDSDWQDTVVHHMNRALLKIELDQALRRRMI